MKKIIFVFLAILPLFVFSQKKRKTKHELPIIKPMICTEKDIFGYLMIKEIKKFQKDLNEEYLDKKETPLRGDNYTKFKQHPFFPIDLKYRVTAKFIKNEKPEPFDLPTSSGKSKSYQEYGKATFSLDGKSYTLTIYQSLDLMKMEKYKDHPFSAFS